MTPTVSIVMFWAIWVGFMALLIKLIFSKGDEE